MKNKTRIFLVAELLYLVVSMSTLVVGTNSGYLCKIYDRPMSQIVLFSSLFAFGRVSSCNVIAKLSEKIEAKKIVIACTIFLMLFCGGIMLNHNFYIGLVLSYFAGVGQGGQDVICPILLSQVSGKNYSRDLSIGQVLYSIGCFVTPFLVTILLELGLPVIYANLIMLIFPIVLLVLTIGIKEVTKQDDVEEESIYQMECSNKKLGIVLVGLLSLAYTCTCSGIYTYTSTYVETIGLSEAQSTALLTWYSLGCIVGAIVFTKIIGKLRVLKTYIICNIICLVSITIAFLLKTNAAFLAAYIISGFCLGDLFAIITIIGGNIGADNPNFIMGYIGFTGGLSDIIMTPLVGKLLERFEPSVAMIYILTTILCSIVFGILLRTMMKEGYQQKVNQEKA